MSLWDECEQQATRDGLDLGVGYNGWDQLMREVMRVATAFEDWACEHVAFEEFSEVWPYFLRDNFGKACVTELGAAGLGAFDKQDCLRVALRLDVPVWVASDLPMPFVLEMPNLDEGSEFVGLRVQSVRLDGDENEWIPFVLGDDPFDGEFESPQFAFYGVRADGRLDHIASRQTYTDLRQLLRNLFPRVEWPTAPTVGGENPRRPRWG
jgi:hypothetical protein